MSKPYVPGTRARQRKHEQLRREIKARREALRSIPIRTILREDSHADQRKH